MKVINIQDDMVSVGDPKHKWGNLAYSWDLDTFESLFGHEFPDDMAMIHYEPERNIFIYGTDIDKPFVISEPAADVHIKWLHEHQEEIFFEVAGLLKGPDYEYDNGTDTWIIPESRKMVLAKMKRQQDRMEILSAALINEFEMILAMFEVGRDKGIWKATDFPQELRDKVALWKQTIADYKAEENS